MREIRIKQITKKKLLIGGCAVLAVLVIILLVRGISGLVNRGTDTSAGVDYIKAEEAGSISAIEEKINLLEQQDNNGEDTRSIKEKFTGAVVMGDSITAGFTGYDVLNASSVAASIGVHLTETDDLISQVKDLSPRIVFLALGMNDVEATNGDIDTFIDQYTAVIEKIEEDVPDVHIFVNSIFPVSADAAAAEPAFEKIPDYNEALKTLCDEMQIGFIDNTDLVQDDYYEQDGVHFKADFYPVWAQRMAEVAAL